MRNRILVVDDAVTQAIQLKVKLANSLYDVELVASLEAARGEIAALPLLLVLVSERIAPIGELLLFCADTASQADGPPLMIYGTGGGGPDAHAIGMKTLAAGAQEYLSLPMDEAAMMARVRSLVRRGFGRFEPPLYDPERQGSSGVGEAVALVSPLASEAIAWRILLDGHLPYSVKAMRTEELLASLRRRDLPAAIILAAPEGQMADLRLLAELKARYDTAEIPVVILGGASGDFAVLALDLGAQDVLPLTFDPAELALRLRLRLAQRSVQLKRQRETSEQLRLASVDPLTGLANRRSTMQRLDRLQLDFAQGGPSFALLLLDIDRFKQVNDSFGHATGDAVLHQVGQTIAGVVREADLLGRIGGEEFLVALRSASLTEACGIAERLRMKVAQMRCAVPGAERVQVTLSIGLCQPEPHETLETVLGRADRALYAAKAMGRNMVEVDV